MAAVTSTAVYSSPHATFLPSSSTLSSSVLSMQSQSSQSQSVSYQDTDLSDDSYPPLFCRALYDYAAQDASALSFHKGDIIEILSQQPSGWWDGLLGDERGWFPSNYVTIISEEDAELAFSGSDFSNAESQSQTNGSQDRNSVVDMSHAMMQGTPEENEQWLENEINGSRNGLDELVNATWDNGPSSDFWMPQVASNGQIYYINTKTGQQSRDLPQDAEDPSDSDLAGLTTSQSSSRSGTSAGLGLASDASASSSNSQAPAPFSAGFGLPRRTGTPEPWVKRLADDGQSYYYQNQVDGTVQWARPEATQSQTNGTTPNPIPSATRVNPPSTTLVPTGSQASGTRPVSVYSDNSDVHPLDPDTARRILNTHSDPPQSQVTVEPTITELTSAERIAQSLQQALASPPPESVIDLSRQAKASIHAVVNNIQLHGSMRRPEDDQQMDELIHSVVLAVRNLLYVSAVPTGSIPSNVLPQGYQHKRSGSSSHSPLKPAQRKVTATLSRLVLSARAIQYDSGSSVADTLSRIEVDASELDRAVHSFVMEAQRIRHPDQPENSSAPLLKRLKAVYATANIGLGLPGAGVAGSWKGFGWVSLDGDEGGSPQRSLSQETIGDVATSLARLDGSFGVLMVAVRSPDHSAVTQIHSHARDIIAQISSFVTLVADIHVARHVDIDGIRKDSSTSLNEIYARTVEQARVAVRTLEAALQAVYDDCAALFVQAQSMRVVEPGQQHHDRDYACDMLNVLITSLKANAAVVHQTLEGLLTIGHDQKDMAQGDYIGSIEWRMSRQSMIDAQFGGALRPLSAFPRSFDPADDEELSWEDAFFSKERKPRVEPNQFPDPQPDPYPPTQQDGSTSSHGDVGHGPSKSLDFVDSEPTFNAPDSPDWAEDSPEFGESIFPEDNLITPKQARKTDKIAKLLGEEAPPWYLLPNADNQDILLDSDTSVKGGTIAALVERLTAHDTTDRNYSKAFLMTFKSFTTLDELFDLLVQRFKIQPPPGLATPDLKQWTAKKKNIVQFRVINTFKSMITDEDILEKEDLYILDRMKEFVLSEDVAQVTASKSLLVLIERAQQNGETKRLITKAAQAPTPLVPKVNKKLKLTDIDPLELARQLTLLESALYQKIRPMECLQRAREQRTDNMDNIAFVIQTSNRIADWVAESVLSKEDSRKRAATVKHLILVADRCRTLNNFSTMIAIVSGLNTPPIRRLKRTWEQVSQRHMAQFGACEVTLDSNRNFNKYRSMLASVIPPCVPFIGVFLSTLQFIQDGNKDMISDNMVNFKKRQMASEVINDIKRWQAHSYNFQVVPIIREYLDESLSGFDDTRVSSDRFWAMSLEREPREREDEKMARLLQESGFL